MKTKARKYTSIVLKIIYLLGFNTHSIVQIHAQREPLFSHTPTTQQQVQHKVRPTLALFDTAGRERYKYQPIINAANRTGFQVVYHPITELIDIDNKYFPVKEYDAANFILSPQFLQTMDTSPVAQKILSLIKRFSQSPNKTTVLMFPPMGNMGRAPVLAIAKLFEQVSVSTTDNKNHYTRVFKNLTNRFLQLPIERRPLDFHTTLHIPHGGHPYKLSQLFSGETLPVALLPLNQNIYSQSIKNLFPLGIYYYNKNKKNHLVITSTSLNFTSIEENFQITPIDNNKKQELSLAIEETISNIYHLTTQNQNVHGLNLPGAIATRNATPIDRLSFLDNQNINKNKKNYTVAWMEIKQFAPPKPNESPKESEKRLREEKILTEYTVDSKLDYAWITINPQMYFNDHGRLKTKIEKFKKILSNSSKKLYERAKSTNTKTPEILVGFEIVNNIYSPHMPKNPAQDLYGKSYHDIPRPLDKTFWEKEFKRPLDTFLNLWKNPQISNNLKIGGVVLDLEMYCRKTTERFLATMGFSPQTISQFLPAQPNLKINPRLFSQYLIDKNLSKKYFSFLENKAEQLGKELRKFVHKRIPNGIIGCYAPNIATSWFYKGFYRGLSTKKNPIHLLTFNTRHHKKYLSQSNIQSHHIGVLMLSKLKNTNSFSIVDRVLQKHDGVWINRFSRLSEPSHNDWSNLEQAPLSTKDKTKFINYLRQKKDEQNIYQNLRPKKKSFILKNL